MLRMIDAIFIGCIALFLAGCGTTGSTVVLVPDPEGKVGQLVVKTEGGEQVLDEANQSVRISDRKTPPSAVKVLSAAEIDSTFSDALAAQPLQPARFVLYFRLGSDELVAASKVLLPELIETIRARGSTDIVVSGHTDTIGTMENNDTLSRDRAIALFRILVANGAVPEDIKVSSHGEGNPLVKTGDNVAEPRNRRVEVVIR